MGFFGSVDRRTCACRCNLLFIIPLPEQRRWLLYITLFHGYRPALPVIVVPPTTVKKKKGNSCFVPEKRLRTERKKEQRKGEGKNTFQGGHGPPTSPSVSSLPSSAGTLSAPMHLTLVVRKNSNTAPAALTSHKSLTAGVRDSSHLHASPTSFQIRRFCSVHDAHRVNKWCLDCGSPLMHQHSAVSDFLNCFR